MTNYLTPKLKEYYQKDFFDNVLTCTDEEWMLHPKLIDLCQQINKNEHIQTIFSRKADIFEKRSYLYFSADEIGAKILEKLANKFNDKFDYFDFFVNKPKKHKTKNLSLKMGCISNEDYFNIDVYCFEYYEPNKREHKKFWKFIKKHLVDKLKVTK
jgi:hypothetical protein